jgi:hypothetical protein
VRHEQPLVTRPHNAADTVEEPADRAHAARRPCGSAEDTAAQTHSSDTSLGYLPLLSARFNAANAIREGDA